jgi:hypothetical protein
MVEILRGGTLPVTAAVYRFITYVKQYEKCVPTVKKTERKSQTRWRGL